MVHDPSGVSRRGFITSMGAGVVGVATLPVEARETPGADVAAAGEKAPLLLRVNGRPHHLRVEPRATLLDVLREDLGLTGTKPGCERGECGACTVLVGDEARYSCMTLALEADGAEVTTIEGLGQGEALGDVQSAFAECDAFQCGFCTPGQVVAVEGLLRANPQPSLEEVREGVSGNLCRCGAYPHIFEAARRAAEARRTGRR
jgi:xanthine dehydrogenase YagT iron-sulfur-binding subunit